MSRITNWENDMIDSPEEKVVEFAKKRYPNYDLHLLSALRHRDMQDIYESLEESTVIIMQPSLLEKEQVIKIIQAISHPIHGHNNGSRRDWNIRDFVFLSADPWRDVNEILTICSGVKDSHNEECLPKILYNCECHFYGFAGEHYELKKTRYPYSSYIIRYK